VDNNDGSYTCGYTVDSRGDYSVSAELDGSPIAGSPDPVFFSGIPGQMTSVKPIPGVVPGVVPGEGGDAPGAAPASESEPIEVTTAQLHVGNLTMNVTAAQLRQLFAHCGEVINARMQHGKQYGFVEMATVEQARSALKLNGMPLDGRNMRVEPAASVRQQPNPHAADAAAREHQNRLNKALELQANLHAQRAAEMAAKRAEGGDAEGAGRGRSPKDERGGRGRSPKDERGGRGRSRSRTQSPRRDDRNRTRSPVKRRRSRSRSRDRGRDRSRDRDRDRDRDRYKPYSRGKRRGGKYGSGGPRNMNPNGVGQ
jgi:RNA recognition motif-containing protein